MIGRAVAIYEDNGESVCVELPTEQELLDRIHEISRDAKTEIDRWQSRHNAVAKALTASAVLNAVLVTGILVRWLL
jgi:hypothetical protein